MNCLINQTLQQAIGKKKRSEVVARYLRLKYRINISLDALKKRLQTMRKPESQTRLTVHC